jgi:hypothetical protein
LHGDDRGAIEGLRFDLIPIVFLAPDMGVDVPIYTSLSVASRACSNLSKLVQGLGTMY